MNPCAVLTTVRVNQRMPLYAGLPGAAPETDSRPCGLLELLITYRASNDWRLYSPGAGRAVVPLIPRASPSP